MCTNKKGKHNYELLKKHWNCAYSIFCASFGDYCIFKTAFTVLTGV